MAGRLLWEGAGTRTYWHDNRDGTCSVETRADIQANKDHISAMRADPERYGQQFKYSPNMHAAHIPAVKQMEMYRKYGVKVWNKHHFKDVMKILRTDPDFQGCIVEPKVFKRTFSSGMVQRNGVWRPPS